MTPTPTAGSAEPPKRDFPIMGSKLIASIPWAMLAPHEEQAQRNHGQSLKRLAERGGLSHSEAIDILQGNRWNTVTHCEANERWLINAVRAWRAESQGSAT